MGSEIKGSFNTVLILAWSVGFLIVGSPLLLAQTAVSSPLKQSQAAAASSLKKEAPLTDDEIFQFQQKYKDALAAKRFDEALILVRKLPDSSLSRPQRKEMTSLLLFDSVEQKVASSSSMFAKEDELDDATKKMVQKLYKEAESAFITNQTELSRDILIHILFLHRQNLRAKFLLEEGLDLKAGSYKIENMEAKYWNKSSISFYGGNYQQSVDCLQALSFFDKDNPTVYERMGSAYYMMGEKERAISAWNTVLFLDPGNAEIQEIIKKTQEMIAEDKEEAKRDRAKPKAAQNVNLADTQLMGKFPKQDQAYEFANSLRKQGVDAIVTEEDDGKWAVRTPKKGSK
ncbi:hypothetical protein EB093_02620 [bacterium]|nr:hypothetical protein [bacterium]